MKIEIISVSGKDTRVKFTEGKVVSTQTIANVPTDPEEAKDYLTRYAEAYFTGLEQAKADQEVEDQRKELEGQVFEV